LEKGDGLWLSYIKVLKKLRSPSEKVGASRNVKVLEGVDHALNRT
jgi:hypothetical protein